METSLSPVKRSKITDIFWVSVVPWQANEKGERRKRKRKKQ